MLIVNLSEPDNCLHCPVRMDCETYREWLVSLDVKKPEMYGKECLLEKEEEK